jgi:hypothetical protein
MRNRMVDAPDAVRIVRRGVRYLQNACKQCAVAPRKVVTGFSL